MPESRAGRAGPGHQGPRRAAAGRSRPAARGGRRQPRAPPWRDGLRRGRIRLGQVGDGGRDHGAAAQRPAHGRARLDPPRGRGPDPGHERPAPRAAWGADGHGLPGADDRAQPDDELRAADRRGPARAHPAGRGGAPAKSAGRHGRGPAARARSTLPRLPAPDLRRPAPAGHDRHGARAGARAADSRRADDRPRRDHAGADPASDPRAAAAARDRGPVHHP